MQRSKGKTVFYRPDIRDGLCMGWIVRASMYTAYPYAFLKAFQSICHKGLRVVGGKYVNLKDKEAYSTACQAECDASGPNSYCYRQEEIGVVARRSNTREC